jgi:3-oxoadipate enol-lactonase
LALHLYAHELGDGPVAVLLHGTCAPVSALAPLARRIASAGRRAILIELPGYDQSPAFHAAYDMSAAHAAVEELLLARGVESASFVGFSSGTYRAFALALRGNVRAERLALLGPMGHLPPDRQAGFGQLAAALRADPSLDLGAILVSQELAPTFASGPQACAEVRGWLRSISVKALVMELDALARLEDLRPSLSRVTAPVLLRVGTADIATPPEWADELARLLPAATLQRVEGAGHALMLEDVDATTRAVEAFLSRS